MENFIPTAKAGQALVAPAVVTTSLVNVDVTNAKENQPALIKLVFADFPADVLRTPEQMKTDLRKFFTKPQLEKLAKAPVNICMDAYNVALAGKDLSVKASYHEIGALQTIDKESKLYVNGVINPNTNRPYAIGDEVETTSNSIWIDGFIDVVKTAEESQSSLDAFWKASDEASEDDDALAE